MRSVLASPIDDIHLHTFLNRSQEYNRCNTRAGLESIQFAVDTS